MNFNIKYIKNVFVAFFCCFMLNSFNGKDFELMEKNSAVPTCIIKFAYVVSNRLRYLVSHWVRKCFYLAFAQGRRHGKAKGASRPPPQFNFGQFSYSPRTAEFFFQRCRGWRHHLKCLWLRSFGSIKRCLCGIAFLNLSQIRLAH